MSRFSVRPDVTPAQIIGVAVAAVPIVANIAQAFGVWTATPAELDSLNQAGQWAIATSGVLFIGDAAIRVGRNLADSRVDAAVHTAEGHTQAAAAAARITVAAAPAPAPAMLGEIDEAPTPTPPAGELDELVDDDTELASPPPDADPAIDDPAIGTRTPAVPPEEDVVDER